MVVAERWRAELEHERWEVYDIANNLRHFEAPPPQALRRAVDCCEWSRACDRGVRVRPRVCVQVCACVRAHASVCVRDAPLAPLALACLPQNVLVMAWDLQVMRAYSPVCEGSGMYTPACPSYHISTAISKSVVRERHMLACALGSSDAP